MHATVTNTLEHFSSIASYSRNARCIMIAFLLELGFIPGFVGFEFLITATILYMEDPASVHSENLYAAMEEHYNYRYSRAAIEGAMRRAIEEAWKNKWNAVWKYYFPTMEIDIMEKPANLIFIGYLSCALRLALGCRDEGKEEVSNHGIE